MTPDAFSPAAWREMRATRPAMATFLMLLSVVAIALPLAVSFGLSNSCQVCTADQDPTCPPAARAQPPAAVFVSVWSVNYAFLGLILARHLVSTFMHMYLPRPGRTEVKYGESWGKTTAILLINAVVFLANLVLNWVWIVKFGCDQQVVTSRLILWFILATAMMAFAGFCKLDTPNAMMYGFYTAWLVFALMLNQDVAAQTNP